MAKNIIKFSIGFIVIILTIFIGFRYSWRLFEFEKCYDINLLVVNDLQVEKDYIYLNGNTIESAPSFIGYVYKISDDNLYIGLKYNVFFGFFERNGNFNIKINENTLKIKNIYLKNKNSEKLIWKN